MQLAPPKMGASAGDHLEIARMLLDRGALVNAISASDGTTALILACDTGHKVARLLLERGANVNAARASDGLTPLMAGAIKGYLPLVNYLLSKGANKSSTTAQGRTARYFANNPAVKSALK